MTIRADEEGKPAQEGCAISIPAGFQDHTVLNAEWPGVAS